MTDIGGNIIWPTTWQFYAVQQTHSHSRRWRPTVFARRKVMQGGGVRRVMHGGGVRRVMHGGGVRRAMHGGADRLQAVHGGGVQLKTVQGGGVRRVVHSGGVRRVMHGGGVRLHVVLGGVLRIMHGGGVWPVVHCDNFPRRQVHCGTQRLGGCGQRVRGGGGG